MPDPQRLETPPAKPASPSTPGVAGADPVPDAQPDAGPSRAAVESISKPLAAQIASNVVSEGPSEVAASEGGTSVPPGAVLAKRTALLSFLGWALAACSGGSEDPPPTGGGPVSPSPTPSQGPSPGPSPTPAPAPGPSPAPAPGPSPAPAPGPAPGPAPAPGPSAPTPVTAAEASRFLAQASFGATESGINEVVARGYAGWIDWQFSLGAASHVAYMNRVIAPTTPYYEQWRYGDNLLDSFYTQALRGTDQLRQRVVFALSQIFVVSQTSNLVYDRPRGHASYLDMLARNAFGSFRTLLEEVATHPTMGKYLSHLGNRKEDSTTGRAPDENFAREVMQLFSIGLVQLNADGTPRTDAAGRTIPTYGNADITGLAKVFTGWSWAGPDTTSNRFRDWGSNLDPERDIKPMQPYPQEHSTSDKRFLGVVIAANTDARTSLRIAIDTLANHPNTGPFIARQLIQRLVTSNPTPAYVARVAAAFADNGTGLRGDMKAVIRAVLLDPEARSANARTDSRFGKLREPVLRLTAWARAFEASSVSGEYRVRVTNWPGWGVGQTPLRPESVFNFFRPGFVPPGSPMAGAGMVAPEFQIIGEAQVTTYLNYMAYVVERGVGLDNDVRCSYAAEAGLAGDAAALVDRVDLLLTGRRLGAGTRGAILGAVQSIPTTAADATLNRVRIAVYLTLCSPEFAVLV
jgi:uncharacterized protein (DUF1800 family)